MGIEVPLEEFIYDLEGDSDNETEDRCIKVLEYYYWSGIPKCPYCKRQANFSKRNQKSDGHPQRYLCSNRRQHEDNRRKEFNVFTGTPIRHRKTRLIKWFKAFWYITNRQRINSWRKELELSLRDAVYLKKRIRQLGDRKENNVLWKARENWLKKLYSEGGF